jgi:hypothetical protein
MSQQNKTGEFARGYALGFKHGKEYKAESNHHETTPNNDNVLTKNNTLYNYYGNFRTYDEVKDEVLKREARKDLFNGLLLDGAKMRLLSKRTSMVSDMPLNPLQKKFAKYYFSRTEANELFIPVIKMRQEGMTDILSEILFREYLAGKRVAYFVPNQKLVKAIKEAFERKRKYYTYVTAIYGGSIDVFGINDLCELNVRLTSEKYDVIIADELGLDVNFNNFVNALEYYAQYNNAIVVLAFTPSQRAKNFEDMKKFVENMECNGKIVYRYNTIAPNVAQRIRQSALANGNNENLTSELLIEMLGII